MDSHLAQNLTWQVSAKSIVTYYGHLAFSEVDAYTLVVKICPVNISPGLNLPEVENCPRNSAEKNSPVESCPSPTKSYIFVENQHNFL